MHIGCSSGKNPINSQDTPRYVKLYIYSYGKYNTIAPIRIYM